MIRIGWRRVVGCAGEKLGFWKAGLVAMATRALPHGIAGAGVGF